MTVKKSIGILLAVCIIFSLSIPAFAGLVEERDNFLTSSSRDDLLKQNRPRCSQCYKGELYSGTSAELWTESGPVRYCNHGKLGMDVELKRLVTVESWCDSCRYSTSSSSYQFRWNCRAS